MALFLVYPLFTDISPSLTIPSGNELYLISCNSLKAKNLVTSVKFETLGDKIQEIDPERINSLIDQLSVCESGNNQLAINPVDKDGTASCGRFQFKRLTWKTYIIKYDLFGWQNWETEDFENALWSGDVQRVVVGQMFKDKDVNLFWEFPDCSRQLGLQINYANYDY